VEKKGGRRARTFELDCGGAENDSVGTERPSPTRALLKIARVCRSGRDGDRSENRERRW
jgi:hypothetical protein